MTIKHTPPISLVDGHYPSLKEIKGLSFRISIVMSATDLSFSDYQQRHDDAERIVTCWNAHSDLVSELNGVSAWLAEVVRSDLSIDQFKLEASAYARTIDSRLAKAGAA